MDTFIIQGGAKLKGDITVMGAKNAATPILAATVLIQEPCTLHNVPRISDVEMMLLILRSMGASVEWVGEHSVRVDCTSLDPSTIDHAAIAKMRSSIFFLGCLAQRFGSITMPYPGGCSIGSRPLDAHFEALGELGYHCDVQNDFFSVSKQRESERDIVMKEFSVTATENVILASVIGDASIRIRCCAAEHVVQDLAWFLQKAGAHIEGIGTHTLAIDGVAKLHGVEYSIMPDPIETGTFIVLAAATHSSIAIRAAAPEFIPLELRRFKEAGVECEVTDDGADPENHYRYATIVPKKVHAIRAVKKIHPMPYPGFGPDLLQPFSLLMTQAQGISLVHDWMFDGRLRYVTELQKMGANITVLDPHRILIIGPTPLYGKEITSYDLRAGATLVLAALIAEGATTIHGIGQVDRGYEKLDDRLRALGAQIDRV